LTLLQNQFNFFSFLFVFLVKVLNADKVEAERGTLGRIVIKLPLPPGTMSTLYRADDRFSSIYFKDYPVSAEIE
jgi:acyl-coenzyme A synthetase/AMP-(fatty) acid ligase